MTAALQSSHTKRLAVISPYGNLRGIYVPCDAHEGRPAFVRVVKEGMDPAATTCIFFSTIFGPGARWFFGKSLPDGKSMRSFSISLEDTEAAQSPEAACWPLEDIFDVREATEEDDRNEYFSPTGISGPRSEGFNPISGYLGASMDNDLSVLGLTTGRCGDLPTLEVVRGAYRKQALRLHPDKGGETRQFQVLQNAYEALVEALIRSCEGTRSPVASPAGQGEARQRKTPSETGMGRGQEGSGQHASPGDGADEGLELPESEKRIRRQNALTAALRRQG